VKIGLTTLVLLVLAVPAQAQSQGPPDPQPQQQQISREGRVRGMQGSGNAPRSAAEQQKARDTEKAYNETIKHIPNQKPADPWGKMR
jgi:hypothetical protein